MGAAGATQLISLRRFQVIQPLLLPCRVWPCGLTAMAAPGIAAGIGNLFNFELAGHLDTLLICGGGTRPVWPPIVSCTLGKYLGASFGCACHLFIAAHPTAHQWLLLTCCYGGHCHPAMACGRDARRGVPGRACSVTACTNHSSTRRACQRACGGPPFQRLKKQVDAPMDPPYHSSAPHSTRMSTLTR